ncbi:MAG: hypothetical protein B7Y83_13705 [Flavobacteriales bacterium 32-34-25]|nr:MAG: hypothetical protein B7Y83_13705 [Flavobacteriales bacterium 32-34-25]
MIRSFIFAILTVFTIQTAVAQQNGIVQGTVSGVDGTIPAASIFIENTKFQTITDDSGKYKLILPQGDYTIVISSIGNKKIKNKISIKSAKNTILNVSLKPTSTELNEIHVKRKSAIQEVKESPFNVVALDAKSKYNTTLDLGHLLAKASGVKIREAGGCRW